MYEVPFGEDGGSGDLDKMRLALSMQNKPATPPPPLSSQIPGYGKPVPKSQTPPDPLSAAAGNFTELATKYNPLMMMKSMQESVRTLNPSIPVAGAWTDVAQNIQTAGAEAIYDILGDQQGIERMQQKYVPVTTSRFYQAPTTQLSKEFETDLIKGMDASKIPPVWPMALNQPIRPPITPNDVRVMGAEATRIGRQVRDIPTDFANAQSGMQRIDPITGQPTYGAKLQSAADSIGDFAQRQQEAGKPLMSGIPGMAENIIIPDTNLYAVRKPGGFMPSADLPPTAVPIRTALAGADSIVNKIKPLRDDPTVDRINSLYIDKILRTTNTPEDIDSIPIQYEYFKRGKMQEEFPTLDIGTAIQAHEARYATTEAAAQKEREMLNAFIESDAGRQYGLPTMEEFATRLKAANQWVEGPFFKDMFKYAGTAESPQLKQAMKGLTYEDPKDLLHYNLDQQDLKRVQAARQKAGFSPEGEVAPLLTAAEDKLKTIQDKMDRLRRDQSELRALGHEQGIDPAQVPGWDRVTSAINALQDPMIKAKKEVSNLQIGKAYEALSDNMVRSAPAQAVFDALPGRFQQFFPQLEELAKTNPQQQVHTIDFDSAEYARVPEMGRQYVNDILTGKIPVNQISRTPIDVYVANIAKKRQIVEAEAAKQLQEQIKPYVEVLQDRIKDIPPNLSFSRSKVLEVGKPFQKATPEEANQIRRDMSAETLVLDHCIAESGGPDRDMMRTNPFVPEGDSRAKDDRRYLPAVDILTGQLNRPGADDTTFVKGAIDGTRNYSLFRDADTGLPVASVEFLEPQSMNNGQTSWRIGFTSGFKNDPFNAEYKNDIRDYLNQRTDTIRESGGSLGQGGVYDQKALGTHFYTDAHTTQKEWKLYGEGLPRFITANDAKEAIRNGKALQDQQVSELQMLQESRADVIEEMRRVQTGAPDEDAHYLDLMDQLRDIDARLASTRFQIPAAQLPLVDARLGNTNQVNAPTNDIMRLALFDLHDHYDRLYGHPIGTRSAETLSEQARSDVVGGANVDGQIRRILGRLSPEEQYQVSVAFINNRNIPPVARRAQTQPAVQPVAQPVVQAPVDTLARMNEVYGDLLIVPQNEARTNSALGDFADAILDFALTESNNPNDPVEVLGNMLSSVDSELDVVQQRRDDGDLSPADYGLASDNQLADYTAALQEISRRVASRYHNEQMAANNQLRETLGLAQPAAQLPAPVPAQPLVQELPPGLDAGQMMRQFDDIFADFPVAGPWFDVVMASLELAAEDGLTSTRDILSSIMGGVENTLSLMDRRDVRPADFNLSGPAFAAFRDQLNTAAERIMARIGQAPALAAVAERGDLIPNNVDATELLLAYGERLSPNQRDWLYDFSERWEQLVDDTPNGQEIQSEMVEEYTRWLATNRLLPVGQAPAPAQLPAPAQMPALPDIEPEELRDAFLSGARAALNDADYNDIERIINAIGEHLNARDDTERYATQLYRAASAVQHTPRMEDLLRSHANQVSLVYGNRQEAAPVPAIAADYTQMPFENLQQQISQMEADTGGVWRRVNEATDLVLRIARRQGTDVELVEQSIRNDAYGNNLTPVELEYLAREVGGQLRREQQQGERDAIEQIRNGIHDQALQIRFEMNRDGLAPYVTTLVDDRLNPLLNSYIDDNRLLTAPDERLFSLLNELDDQIDWLETQGPYERLAANRLSDFHNVVERALQDVRQQQVQRVAQQPALLPARLLTTVVPELTTRVLQDYEGDSTGLRNVVNALQRGEPIFQTIMDLPVEQQRIAMAALATALEERLNQPAPDLTTRAIDFYAILDDVGNRVGAGGNDADANRVDTIAQRLTMTINPRLDPTGYVSLVRRQVENLRAANEAESVIAGLRMLADDIENAAAAEDQLVQYGINDTFSAQELRQYASSMGDPLSQAWRHIDMQVRQQAVNSMLRRALALDAETRDRGGFDVRATAQYLFDTELDDTGFYQNYRVPALLDTIYSLRNGNIDHTSFQEINDLERRNDAMSETAQIIEDRLEKYVLEDMLQPIPPRNGMRDAHTQKLGFNPVTANLRNAEMLDLYALVQPEGFDIVEERVRAIQGVNDNFSNPLGPTSKMIADMIRNYPNMDYADGLSDAQREILYRKLTNPNDGNVQPFANGGIVQQNPTTDQMRYALMMRRM